MTRITDKPKKGRISKRYGTEQYFSVTIQKGQSIGLLLALTYTTTMQIITARH